MIYSITTEFEGINGAYVEPVAKRGEHIFSDLLFGEKVTTWDGKPVEFVLAPSDVADPKDPIPWDYLDYCHLMHKRLAEVIRGAGVENIETFPAIIKSDDGSWISEDFVAFNIFGGNYDVLEFKNEETLVVDMKKVPKYTLFTATAGKILCTEQVAEVIKKGDFRGVCLTLYEEKK
jgi:hypothetical protein